MRHPIRFSLCAALSWALLCAPLHAALPPDVLAKNRWMELTRADYDAVLQRVPPKLRYEFATSPRRVQTVLNSLLVTKTLAAQAKLHGTRPGPIDTQATEGLQEDRALASAELKRIEADAAAAFDKNKAAFEAKAKEIYELNRKDYMTPEEVRLSDIAILVKGRGDEAAKQRAAEARAKITRGEDFAAVAREYSDDPTSRDKGGALPFVTAKGMAPALAKSVFAMKAIGEVSEPIRAPSAYHVVRLEERRAPKQKPFEEVREEIMQAQRQRYVAEQRDLRIQAVHQDPALELNQPAIDALVNRVDPKAFRAPLEQRRPQKSK
jgi:peptidyl-prolyl cis-trans isomerase C